MVQKILHQTIFGVKKPKNLSPKRVSGEVTWLTSQTHAKLETLCNASHRVHLSSQILFGSLSSTYTAPILMIFDVIVVAVHIDEIIVLRYGQIGAANLLSSVICPLRRNLQLGGGVPFVCHLPSLGAVCRIQNRKRGTRTARPWSVQVDITDLAVICLFMWIYAARDRMPTQAESHSQ